jgi:hypothetical protein
MQNRFQNLPFKVSTLDGRNFALLSDVFYISKDGTRYCMIAGSESDGASTPQAVWNLIPPFGKYWPAAFLHDCAYRNTLRIWDGLNWVQAGLEKDECDSLLKEAMESLGVNPVELETIYEAVSIAGRAAFYKDRNPC